MVLVKTLIFIQKSNKHPQFDSDEGIKRRGLLEILTNRFLNEDDYNMLENKNGFFKRDKDLNNKFIESDEYKMAFINLILPYAVSYYQHGLIINDDVKKNFKNLCSENDMMSDFLSNNYITTYNDEDRVYKLDILAKYNSYYNTKCKFTDIISDIKRLLKYDRDKRIDGKKRDNYGYQTNRR